MRVVWTVRAADRLEEIESFIARSSPRRAERFIRELMQATTKQLSQHPRSGRLLADLPGSRLRERIHDAYRIVYGIRKNRVEILTVFEGHRLLRPAELDTDESG